MKTGCSLGIDTTVSVNGCFEDNISVWHQRLGHPSENILHHLPIYSNQKNSLVCVICLFAKQTKLPFPINNTVSDEVFDLIHIDIWGPLQTKEPYWCTLLFFLQWWMIIAGPYGCF